LFLVKKSWLVDYYITIGFRLKGGKPMSHLSFDSKNTAKEGTKRVGKGWDPLEEAVPGGKDLLHETCAMLCLTYAPSSVRQNKKSRKGITTYKYHIVTEKSSKQINKLATIYLDSKKNYKVKFFTHVNKPHEAVPVKFSTIDELREALNAWLISL
jgi:hypothetical protein